MGITENTARFLLYCQAQGVDYSQTIMLGRQGLYLSRRQLLRAFKCFDQPLRKEEGDELLLKDNRFAEGFFQRLGAAQVESIDFSDAEKPTRVHDMNTPIPDAWKNTQSAVFDGGTLEHVFNFPTAVRNAMEMVKIGGHFLASTPANNFFGHGFYQFSPELLFRILSIENGFRIINMIATEDFVSPKWYAVRDPHEVHGRVILANPRPVTLHVLAERISAAPIFQNSPQQSDYVIRWRNEAGVEAPTSTPQQKWMWVKQHVPTSVWITLIKCHQRLQYGFRRKHFLRFRPWSGDPYPLKYAGG